MSGPREARQHYATSCTTLGLWHVRAVVCRLHAEYCNAGSLASYITAPEGRGPSSQALFLGDMVSVRGV